LGETDKKTIMYRITQTGTNTSYEKEQDQIVDFLRELLSKKYLALQFEKDIGFVITESKTVGSDLVYKLRLAGNTIFEIKFKNVGDSLNDATFYYKDVKDVVDYTQIKKFSALVAELKEINQDIIDYNNIQVETPKPMKKPVINVLPYVTAPTTTTTSSIDKEEEIETLWNRLPGTDREILRELHSMDVESFRRSYCSASKPILTKIVNQLSSLDKDTRDLILTLTGCLSKGKAKPSTNYDSDDYSDEE
jgi:hypothetical protein